MIASTPVARANESVVRVEAVGLCGSDLHPCAAGGAGVVIGGPLDGRRVAVDSALPCGCCERCLTGNRGACSDVVFAEHGVRRMVSWPTEALHPLPDSIDGVTGALLEPLGVALHAFDLGQVRLAGDVAVVGCGPLGLLLVQVAVAAGARRVVAVDPLAHRRAAACRAGAALALAPGELGPTPPRVDVAFEVAGTDDALDGALALTRPGGRVVAIGIPADDRSTFDAALARRKCLTVMLTRRIRAAFSRAIALVESGKLDVDWLVTQRFALARVDDAFASAAARQGLKVVVEP